jgi:hypothetical protein
MNNAHYPPRTSRDTIIAILVVMSAVATAIILMSAPFEKLLGNSVYGWRSAFHGLLAGITLITMTIGLYQALRLWSGDALNIRELEAGSVLNASACFMTIIFGNWVRVAYSAENGPRSYFLETAPDIHKIFFEFKELSALFTLPLAVGAAYLICYYGERLSSNRVVRETTALLLGLAFFYFLIAFGLGAAITKLRPV